MPVCHDMTPLSIIFSKLPPETQPVFTDSIEEFNEILGKEDILTPKGFKEFERGTLEACLQLGQRLIKSVLEAENAQLAAAYEQDGQVYRRRKATPHTIITLLGSVTYERSRYRTREAGASRVPLDESIGLLSEHLTRAVASICVQMMAHCPAREAHEILTEIGGATPSVSTLQRLSQRMHADLEALAKADQTQLRSLEDIPDETASVTLSHDGVMVPLKAGGGCWREAACGTIAFHDDKGERLKTLYFGRMPESGKVTLKAQLAREVAQLRALCPEIKLLAAADGAVDNWTFLDGLQPDARVIDFWHACEHLKVVAEHADKPKDWFEDKRKVLRYTPDGVERVIRAVRYLLGKTGSPEAVKELKRELNYFRKHRCRMHYAYLKEQNLAIGSGIVEAANKVLVTQRMKRSGMRWGIHTGQAILSFRAVLKSGLFKRTWSDLMDYRDAAANDNYPPLENDIAA